MLHVRLPPSLGKAACVREGSHIIERNLIAKRIILEAAGTTSTSTYTGTARKSTWIPYWAADSSSIHTPTNIVTTVTTSPGSKASSWNSKWTPYVKSSPCINSSPYINYSQYINSSPYSNSSEINSASTEAPEMSSSASNAMKKLLSGRKGTAAAKSKGAAAAAGGASKAKKDKDPEPSRFSPFDAEPSAATSAASAPFQVNEGRIRELRSGALGTPPAKRTARGKDEEPSRGPVIYWMSRDQRTLDNWALTYAVQKAKELNVPVAVSFNLVKSFLGAKARHFGFMLRGLRVVEDNLKKLGIPFFMFQGKAEETIPEFAERVNASLLIMDFSPLRIGRRWREAVVAALDQSQGGEGRGTAVHEVDAHNVVPVWVASEKLEYAARTIRTKIHRNLPEYLVEYPKLPLNPSVPWNLELPAAINWDDLIAQVTREGPEVPEVTWLTPGEDAAHEALSGPNGFLMMRLKGYTTDRNDPSRGPTSLSGLSPWLHYGHISAQRCALEARKHRSKHAKSVDSFLEELVVRRELSDNFCYYQPKYDSLEGAWDWARGTLEDHRNDKREHVYTREQLEKAQTYDELWNAAQLEMVHYGKMHGFMRMYWAKKILEWTSSPDVALADAIYLNDKYELDGRDPNGYVGCMWSICGVHDQGWGERAVFGKIRYMNYAGCKRKFDIDGYVRYVKLMVNQVKKAAAAEGLASTQPMTVAQKLLGKKVGVKK